MDAWVMLLLLLLLRPHSTALSLLASDLLGNHRWRYWRELAVLSSPSCGSLLVLKVYRPVPAWRVDIPSGG
ncbi:hypothetical protein B0T20DRAFT_398835 [Sordaria brevicollis]|uniref:Secreted protein n=1 Tax=Sordaria brevicollis TaxID=83679 RepID=A0AAE0PMM6_SORBR|nr:hypothetical protein B0T20DRAFT_398835 [Sordaria brevicollis]